MFPIELLVPIGLFVGGIIVSIMTGSLAMARMGEGQKAVSKDLGHTAAYEAPFITGKK